MPRFNVQHPVTKEWRCFSTVVDDYVTDWMDEERYQRWRIEQYGKQAGEIRDANLMDYEDAEQIIANRKRWGAEGEEEWRCFSTIVDDYVTDWMDEERYQKCGQNAGEIRDANLMDYEDAEQIIANRKRWGAEGEEETLKRETRFARIKNTLTIEEMAQLLCTLSMCSLCVANGYCHDQHTGYIDWLKEEMEGSEA